MITFLRSIALCAVTLSSLCIAQSNLGFTDQTTSLTCGKTYNFKYNHDNSSSSSVVINLVKTSKYNQIGSVYNGAATGSFDWLVSQSYANGTDYYLQIIAGSNAAYTSQLSISGGDANSIAYASAITASLSSVGASLSSAVANSASVSSYQAAIASYSAAIYNLTALTNTSSMMTTAAPSAGTGLGMATTNGTGFVSPTLTTSSATTSITVATSTTATVSSSSTAAAAKAVNVLTGSSPIALILCGIAGLLL